MDPPGVIGIEGLAVLHQRVEARANLGQRAAVMCPEQLRHRAAQRDDVRAAALRRRFGVTQFLQELGDGFVATELPERADGDGDGVQPLVSARRQLTRGIARALGRGFEVSSPVEDLGLDGAEDSLAGRVGLERSCARSRRVRAMPACSRSLRRNASVAARRKCVAARPEVAPRS